ncbi:hypothetical protein DRQ32_00570 [bacterium]|nr:MAG: hypothetical protein DRQ32_00570 [bacterium]
MWLLKTLLFIVLLAALVFVGLKNNSAVELDLFGWQLADIPLYFVLYGAALVGLALGLGFAAVRELQWRLELSRQRSASAEAEEELRGLRMASLDAPVSDEGPGDQPL